jgi:putative transposase
LLEGIRLIDIFIACIDNLNGFSEAIASMYPQTEIQSSVVHQIRNYLKYVARKNQREFMKDLKLIYKAETKELSELKLEELVEKLGQKYAVVINSWQN